MIGGAFRISVTCQVAFDMATEDMGDGTIRQKINYASGALLVGCCILEGSNIGSSRSNAGVSGGVAGRALRTGST